jgi:hypothetical protein
MSRCNARVIFLVPNNKGANVSAKIFVQLFSGRFYPPTKTHITHFYHRTGSFVMFFLLPSNERTREPAPGQHIPRGSEFGLSCGPEQLMPRCRTPERAGIFVHMNQTRQKKRIEFIR